MKNLKTLTGFEIKHKPILLIIEEVMVIFYEKNIGGMVRILFDFWRLHFMQSILTFNKKNVYFYFWLISY